MSNKESIFDNKNNKDDVLNQAVLEEKIRPRDGNLHSLLFSRDYGKEGEYIEAVMEALQIKGYEIVDVKISIGIGGIHRTTVLILYK